MGCITVVTVAKKGNCSNQNQRHFDAHKRCTGVAYDFPGSSRSDLFDSNNYLSFPMQFKGTGVPQAIRSRWPNQPRRWVIHRPPEGNPRRLAWYSRAGKFQATGPWLPRRFRWRQFRSLKMQNLSKIIGQLINVNLFMQRIWTILIFNQSRSSLI